MFTCSFKKGFNVNVLASAAKVGVYILIRDDSKLQYDKSII